MFIQFLQNILKNLPSCHLSHEKQPAKIISIKSKPRKWIAYAAAACIAALMFGGGYYYMQGNTLIITTQQRKDRLLISKVQQAISQLSDDEIDNYLNNDNTDVYTPQNDAQDINIKSLS